MAIFKSKIKLLKSKIEWSSKLIDLVIVIIGITIAFQLNSWNESKKLESEAHEYISNFLIENKSNKSELNEALEYSLNVKMNLDSLKNLLQAENLEDKKITALSATMIGRSNFNPTTTTMENIIASGKFELIKDINLRKQIISTYNEYKNTLNYQNILSNYGQTYVIPFYHENFKFRNYEQIKLDVFKDPKFENIVFGYEVLLSQQIEGYKESLELVKVLNDLLTETNTN